MMHQSMTVSEVAIVLRLTPRTIRNMIGRGEIPGAVKIGKQYIIPSEEVSKMISPQKAELTPERRECVREILDLMAGAGTGPGRQKAMELRQKDRERFKQTHGRRM